MRYRPFGATGLVASAVALRLTETAAAAHGPDLVVAALEAGVNTFLVSAGEETALSALADGLSGIERRLVIVGVAVGGPSDGVPLSPAGASATAAAAIARLGLGELEFMVLDRPSAADLAGSTLPILRRGREAGLPRLVGVLGDDEAFEAPVAAKAIDLLATPYHLASGWRERNLIKLAGQQNMTVLGYGYFPASLAGAATAQPESAQPRLRDLFRRSNAPPEAAEGQAAYRFLWQTPQWSAQEICLAYALTEPGLSSVLIEPADLDELETLAAVSDRDMPSQLAAQIEMARFMPGSSRSA